MTPPGRSLRDVARSQVPVVSLRQMSEDEYAAWRPRSLETFAEDLARATGRPLEAARGRAQAVFEDLLPDGLATARTWLWIVLDADGGRVGTLWIGPHPQRQEAAFVYDLEIEEPFRRRGHGRAAMLAAEGLVAQAGVTELGLSVFGFNGSAKDLYDSIGYTVVATQMTKPLQG